MNFAEPKCGGILWLCADCTIRVSEAILAPVYGKCTSRSGNMKEREFLCNVTKIAAYFSLEQSDGDEEDVVPKRRVTASVTPTNAPSASDDDLLDWVWLLARPLIPRYCFTRSFIVTICRVLLINNGKQVKGVGRSAFCGHVEGEDVLRFALVIYAAHSASIFDLFQGSLFVEEFWGLITSSPLGSATPKGGPWDVRYKNLIGFPGRGMLQRYISTPLSLASVLCVSSEAINKVITVLKLSRMIGISVALTFDKVCATASLF
jgi:hypothetical protein